MKWQRETINKLIEEAFMEADQKGIKVLSLGLLNQASQSICLKSLIILILTLSMRKVHDILLTGNFVASSAKFYVSYHKIVIMEKKI